jgi:catechol 2,3-dioxygenase-like lactoylglutathione lyase family enzyme
MSIDHVSIAVPSSRFDEVVNWYIDALAPLGFTKQKEFPGPAVGLGPDRLNILFWIGAKGDSAVAATHVAFRVTDRATVERFYEEAVKAGGKDNGKPGWRHQYHPKYYAGFVLDPVGSVITCSLKQEAD